MRVKFECEKCGHVLDAGDGILANREGEDYLVQHLYKAQTTTCPVCNPPQLNYGPLTEEMVAEALAGDFGVYTAWERERKQARFVVRLLEECNRGPDSILSAVGLISGDLKETTAWWRDRLLELAREP